MNFEDSHDEYADKREKRRKICDKLKVASSKESWMWVAFTNNGAR
jgi:hypothetical protein